MLKKICFLVNEDRYGVKNFFTEKLAEAIGRRGVETKIVVVPNDTLKPKTIKEIHNFKPSLLASFCEFVPDADNKFLWDYMARPCWSVLTDLSLYDVALTRSPFSVISCADRFDCADLSEEKSKKVFFFPHAVERDLQDVKPMKSEYDVVFMGSCFDYENLRLSWKQWLDKPVCEMLDEAIDIVLSDTTTSVQAGLVQAWNNTGLDPRGIDFLKLFYYLDKYVRGYDRVQLVRGIKDAHVHIFGGLSDEDEHYKEGWGAYLKEMSNVTIHSAVAYEETRAILRRSKICLNSSPFFKNGLHERILSGPACGALVVTNENLFVSSLFKKDEEIIFFPPKGWGSVNDKINHFLSDEEIRQEAVAKAREKVFKDHTWDARLEQTYDTLQRLLKE
ncbi:MAG: glycosyltransferase family 1 protein [Chlamydiales bacterium]|nr:glycosyltransferase family 1 protein [Chlamydiia bacterium]MCP5507850.1 glycosyltransferase family 1 protein [Chlamydiales bacterium]